MTTQPDLFATLTSGIDSRLNPEPEQTEEQKRDAVLDRMEITRADLISIARMTARDIAAENGTVTSPEVFAQMKADGYGPDLSACDPRWMGAVFRRGWKRVGWESGGSHGRPVARWEVKS